MKTYLFLQNVKNAAMNHSRVKVFEKLYVKIILMKSCPLCILYTQISQNFSFLNQGKKSKGALKPQKAFVRNYEVNFWILETYYL